jgi:hypothetical protein
VTDAAALLKKAQAYLDESKVFITSLELTALDLSYMDRGLDTFTVGDMIRVRSLPHGVNEDFQLSKMTEDFLQPHKSKITLGKDIQSLTRADVAGDAKSHKEIQDTALQIQSQEVDVDAITSAATEAAMEQASQIYVPQTYLATLEGRMTEADAGLQQQITANSTAISTEANTRAGIINKVDGTVHISGGAPINMLGGKIDIDGSEINFHKEARFPNGFGIRVADKDGNFYYVLRVDNANSCVIGNDYTNLYLRGKEAVYLHKTGAVVTSDQREKNSIEELPAAYEDLLDKLTPRRFRYNGRGGRYHVGFVAQEVEQALTDAGLSREDFGGFVDLNGDGSALGLAYDEFIGLLLQKIRRLEQRIEAMEG